MLRGRWAGGGGERRAQLQEGSDGRETEARGQSASARVIAVGPRERRARLAREHTLDQGRAVALPTHVGVDHEFELEGVEHRGADAILTEQLARAGVEVDEGLVGKRW